MKVKKNKKTLIKEELKPTVEKAVDMIKKKYGKTDHNFTIAFISGKTVVIPKQNRGPGSAMLDTTDYIKITSKRIREKKKPFDGIIMYRREGFFVVGHETMCPTTRYTFDRFKRRNPEFHCIVANTNKNFKMYWS